MTDSQNLAASPSPTPEQSNQPQSAEALTREQLIKVLHPAFDEQIINYGAYDLVYATGSAIYRNPDIDQHQEPMQEHFLVGYQEVPDEVIIAPIRMPDVTPAGTASTIDNTNALHAYRVGEHSVAIESVNGSSFLLIFEDAPEITTIHGTGVLNQSRDVSAFREFVTSRWPVL